MTSTHVRAALAALLCAILCPLAAAGPGLPAFPGAEGFGAQTPGGRGGRVVAVTTLADYAPGEEPIAGSLRAACDLDEPRIVVFRVSGIIELKRTLEIAHPYITIAGQSAPGAGICLKDHACVVHTHDVILRHLRFRPGDLKGVEQDALSVSGSRDIVIDHCSTSWGTDETLSVSGAGQTDITVQWCIIAESLDESLHRKGAHGYGTLLRTDGNVSFHHNLYAHHRTRCPRPGTYGEPPGLLLDFRNHAIYNWMASAGYSADDPVRMNYVANYLKPGPSTRDRTHAFRIGGDATTLFVAGNVVEGAEPAPDDNWALIAGAAETHKAPELFATPAVTTLPADEAFRRVLDEAGATRPARDAVDARIVDAVRNGTGAIINSQVDVGGWPEYASAEPPADADLDGMPDAWETAHKLNPRDAADAAGDRDGDGYTNIEEFLNQTDPGRAHGG
ncbi:MAG: pectate lyase [Candidatus Hydrogenedentes bacterium]|nr:pectate lyase [Candidatus Hydrogenedentota bacterium]